MTLEEFLQFEDASEEKHEFHDGVVVAMAGASFAHVSIAANVGAVLGARLRGKQCRALGSDMRLWVKQKRKLYYPDVSIVCGTPEFREGDKSRSLVCNPTAIFEVTSPSTDYVDRTKKFDAYREIESLQEYVLISQTKPEVETFHRGSDGLFVIAGTIYGLDAQCTLRSLGITLKLADIYAGIEFDPPLSSATEHGNPTDQSAPEAR